MYCRAGQCTEEEMYNNETAGPALEEFLQLLGEKVRLKGFTKYRAQLDTKSNGSLTHPHMTHTQQSQSLRFYACMHDLDCGASLKALITGADFMHGLNTYETVQKR